MHNAGHWWIFPVAGKGKLNTNSVMRRNERLTGMCSNTLLRDNTGIHVIAKDTCYSSAYFFLLNSTTWVICIVQGIKNGAHADCYRFGFEV